MALEASGRRRLDGQRRRQLVDEVRQYEQVVGLPGRAAHVTAQATFLLEAELGEHVEEAILAGDDVDDELDDAEFERFDRPPVGRAVDRYLVGGTPGR